MASPVLWLRLKRLLRRNVQETVFKARAIYQHGGQYLWS